MKQCTNPASTTNGAAAGPRTAGNRRGVQGKSGGGGGAPNADPTMTATLTNPSSASSTKPANSPATTTTMSATSNGDVLKSSSKAVKDPAPPGGKASSKVGEVPPKPGKQHQPHHHHHHIPASPYPSHLPYSMAHHLHHHHAQLSAKVAGGKLGAGVDHLAALNLLPAHLRDMFLAAHLLRGYYQPAGPLISPHLLPQPPSSGTHGPGLSGLLGKSGPDGGSPLSGPPPPPSSSTADSTDSDVLLTGGDLTPRSSQQQQLQQQQQQQQQQQAAAAYGASRYGPPATGPLYGRPMQMHCPPAYLPPNYYAPSPYGQPPAPHPPPPPPPEMYYTHAYPAHYYPKFAAPPQYYPTSRRYYPGPPAPGTEHLYEQAPPGGAPVPAPPPPPAGAQLVPAGPPQGPQHLDHYPYPAYPGYGSPGPGSGGQCYSRNLPHPPPPPPPFMDAHYTTNCPCPMQCPKNVNAGSLIGIKASKGPVSNNNNNNNNNKNHIVQSQSSMSTEPITISSSSSSASSTASPAPLDIHAPITVASERGPSDPSTASHHHGGYHHGHHGMPPHHHPGHQYHPHPMYQQQQQQQQQQQPPPPSQQPPTSDAPLSTGGPTSTVAPSAVPVTSTHLATTVTTAVATSADHLYHHHHHHQHHRLLVEQPPPQPHHPAKMCYKTEPELGIKPESAANLLPTAMHYGSPYHHHLYHPAMGGYYPHHHHHHPKLADMKEEPPAPMPPYTIASKLALLETPELSVSPARGSTGLSVPMPPMPGEAVQPVIGSEKEGLLVDDVAGKTGQMDDKHKGNIPPTALVKQEIEEFKLELGLVDAGGMVCKKEDFEENGPAMTPDLPLDERVVIKKDGDDEKKPPTSDAPSVDVVYHQQQQQLHHQMQPPVPPLTHHLQGLQPHHNHQHHQHHHHSASTNLLHGSEGQNHLYSHAAHLHGLPQNGGVEPSALATAEPIPPDSKSLLAELVLTTEASMEARAVVSSCKTFTTTTMTTATTATVTTTLSGNHISSSSSSTVDEMTVQPHQPRASSSSDSSISSVSDSLATPSADADGPCDATVQSSDDGAARPSPPTSPCSAEAFPSSTVKRRPLLVACKKANPKQSPPNSYKNLIKRTNGLDEPPAIDEVRPVECIEAVELSDDEEVEEEEVDEEEEEEEEEEDDDDEDDEEQGEEEEEEEDTEQDEEEDEDEGTLVNVNGEQEDGAESNCVAKDVEDVELEEQRNVLAEQHRQRKVVSRGASKLSTKKRTTSTTTTKPKLAIVGEGRRKKGCVRKLLATSATTTTTTTTTTTIVIPRERQRRQSGGTRGRYPPTARRSRFVKRIHRVFRTSLDSLKRLPPALRGRLLGRSGVSLVPARRQIRSKRSARLPDTLVPTPALCDKENSVPATICIDDCAAPAEDKNALAGKDQKEATAHLPSQQQAPVSAEPVSDIISDSAVPATKEPSESISAPPLLLSNVDRTIDLVARGYFSEPEVLTSGSADLKVAHSRAWLKKLKQQQQQEGRSHSEQSRGAANKSSCPRANAKKSKQKALAVSPLVDSPALAASQEQVSLASGTDKKKSKSKAKSAKTEPEGDVQQSAESASTEAKGKKKSTAKENKKESSSKKKKLKTQNADEGEGRSRKRVKTTGKAEVVPPKPDATEEAQAMFQRATSTPIPPVSSEPAMVVSGVNEEGAGSQELELDLRKECLLDESAVTLLDHSSVIDDRETDFDDAATMLVEDDVASVDTSVLITQHHHHHNNNNNNNCAVTDKNNPLGEEPRMIAADLPAVPPLQAVIAEGKEGSELEPPEGMEPFLDEEEQEEEEEQRPAEVLSTAQLLPPPVLTHPQVQPSPMELDYEDDEEQPAQEELEEEKEQLRKRSTGRSAKRRRSRSKSKSKFSTKKRHRPSHRGPMAELEELVVPRKCNTIPRWSNGWTWEGQPFQGKVFLNSDDPPVVRTCYPAMRHSEGDIIRPRDCVLLRAGSKRAELPYVAKVAYLWENPEDGEMMMSLLWYYRPEHTEQGRQRTDGPDEVFASRHKDHNSVACIEDKCYVLTFSEYCRFRRQLKGLEENIEEQPSIVPALRRENPRLPPAIVSPELVMYCQRVYEFRLKRLLKSTS